MTADTTAPDETDWAWIARGACRSVDPEGMFVEGTAQSGATAICAGCPVRTECLAHALDNRELAGVWGGTTAKDRRRMLRLRPQVTSWRALLLAARADHERTYGRATVPAGSAQSLLEAG